MFRFYTIALLLALALLGCYERKTTDSEDLGENPPAMVGNFNENHKGHDHSGHQHGSLDPHHLRLGNMTFDIPKGWKREKPASSMRVAQFALKGHPQYKVKAFYFKAKEGVNIVKENIDRWKMQFGKKGQAKTIPLEKKKVYLAVITGDQFVDTMSQKKPQDSYMVIGAIIPITKQGYISFKLTGPEKIISGQVKNFKKFLTSKEKKKYSRHIDFNEFTLTAPKSWVREKPSSNMRKAQFHPQNNPSLKAVVYYFGNRGGDNAFEANYSRWQGQFTKVEKKGELSLKMEGNPGIRLVSIEGTFKKKPFPMAKNFTPQPDSLMLAALIPTTQGPYYVRMVGPKKEVEKEVEAFKAFLKSYKGLKK